MSSISGSGSLPSQSLPSKEGATGAVASRPKTLRGEHIERGMHWGDDARSAPTTPSNWREAVDKTRVDPQIVKAAQGFETMFLEQMMQTMRKTIPENEMGLDNGATKIYQSMLDGEYAQTAVRTGGIGLAEQIIAHLDPSRYTLKPGAPESSPVNDAQGRASESRTPVESTGGTDEGLE